LAIDLFIELNEVISVYRGLRKEDIIRYCLRLDRLPVINRIILSFKEKAIKEILNAKNKEDILSLMLDFLKMSLECGSLFLELLSDVYYENIEDMVLNSPKAS